MWDSNPRMVLSINKLATCRNQPLCQHSIFTIHRVGIEPTTRWSSTNCSTFWATDALFFIAIQRVGIEPTTPSVWTRYSNLLSYRCLVLRKIRESNPCIVLPTRWFSRPVHYRSANLPYIQRVGLEPTPLWLKVRCSTIWATVAWLSLTVVCYFIL